MPSPINSIKTRVISKDGGYLVQLSTNGLEWFNLPDPVLLQRLSNVTNEDRLSDAKYYAARMAMYGQEPPATGKVVWHSEHNT